MNNQKIKKVLYAVIITVILAGVAFGIGWLVKNWNALISGTQLYTQSQYTEYGESKYQEGLGENETYLQLVDKFNEDEKKIVELEKRIEELLGYEHENSSYKTLILNLREELKNVKNERDELQQRISAYEKYENQLFEIKFYTAEDEIFKVELIKRDEVLDLSKITTPQKDFCEFLGWSFDKESVVSTNIFTITENLNFYAIFEMSDLAIALEENNLAILQKFTISNGQSVSSYGPSSAYKIYDEVKKIINIRKENVKLLTIINGESIIVDLNQIYSSENYFEVEDVSTNEVSAYNGKTWKLVFNYNEKTIRVEYYVVFDNATDNISDLNSHRIGLYAGDLFYEGLEIYLTIDKNFI